jgi:hypothetical protein
MKLLKKEIKIERPQQEKVDRQQPLKPVKAFSKRKEKLIASIREGSHSLGDYGLCFPIADLYENKILTLT